MSESGRRRSHAAHFEQMQCVQQKLGRLFQQMKAAGQFDDATIIIHGDRSEEHTSELQSLMRISYAVFCLKKKKHNKKHRDIETTSTNYIISRQRSINVD